MFERVREETAANCSCAGEKSVASPDALETAAWTTWTCESEWKPLRARLSLRRLTGRGRGYWGQRGEQGGVVRGDATVGARGVKWG